MHLITITQRQLGDSVTQTVNARDLHEFLQVGSAFKDWIARRIADYSFRPDQDFCSFLSESHGGRPSREYAITIDMAKELSMVERNERGKQARQYFIECERKAKTVDPMAVLNDPAAMRGLLLTYSEKVLALEAKVAEQAPSVSAMARLADAEGAMCLTSAAKALQVPPRKMIAWLEAKRWIYRRAGNGNWLAYQNRIQQGVLKHKVTTLHRDDGDDKTVEQVKVTPKGLALLACKLPLYETAEQRHEALLTVQRALGSMTPAAVPQSSAAAADR